MPKRKSHQNAAQSDEDSDVVSDILGIVLTRRSSQGET